MPDSVGLPPRARRQRQRHPARRGPYAALDVDGLVWWVFAPFEQALDSPQCAPPLRHAAPLRANYVPRRVFVYPRSKCARQTAVFLMVLQRDLLDRKRGRVLGDGFAVLATHDPDAAMVLADAETAQDPR